MNELKLFESPDFGGVRTLETEAGKVLFCGSDVAKALGYSNPHDALIKHCKKDGVANCEVIDSMGRTQSAKFITEGNVYRLIAHSKLPNAERFEKWVFDEVLPTIRKTGGYSAEKPDSFMIEDPIERAQRWIEEQKEKKLLTAQVSALTVDNEIMRPKAEYFDDLVDRKLLTNFRDTAKELKIGQTEFVGFLIDRKYIYRDQRGRLCPYAKHIDSGLFEIKEYSNSATGHVGTQALITPKGRETFRLLCIGHAKDEQ